MNAKQIEEFIKNNLSELRYKHSHGVADTAKHLAGLYNANEEKAYFSGLAHDLAKEFSKEKTTEILLNYGKSDLLEQYTFPLLHGPCASILLKEKFNIHDEEILDAVFYHTTGKENMNLLTKIIYLADFIEPNRKFEGVEEVRSLSEKFLDDAIILASRMIIDLNIAKGKTLHKDTILARDYLLNKTN